MAYHLSLYLMAALYFAAGALHFIRPGFYRPIVPRWLSAHDFLIYASGVAEVALPSGCSSPPRAPGRPGGSSRS